MDEFRTFTEPVEVRELEGGQKVAVGYAARFNSMSQNLGGFVERVAPGTFAKTIVEADIRGLFNHDSNMVLGRNRSGTLRLAEDDDGLAYEIDLPDTTTGRDVAELLERGDVTGSSFGFTVLDDEWDETDDGFPMRTLKTVALRDVGPVTFPAYNQAEAGLRSLAESRNLDPDTVIEAAQRNELATVLSWTVDAIEILGQTPGDNPAAERTAPARHRFWYLT